MAAHIKRRGSVWYLVDGSARISLKTSRKGLAEHRLEQYIKGKYGLTPTPTVGEFFERWIAGKVEPLVRRGTIRDWKQHFHSYILPKFRSIRLGAIDAAALREFQVELIGRGLAVKSVRNVIGGSFQAMFRDARGEIAEIEGRNPFIDVKWPRIERAVPDPFTAGERDAILAYMRKKLPFWYPWVFVQFHTGMRPSESTALRVKDVDFQTRQISINKSRYMRAEDKPKTRASRRVIVASGAVIDAIKSQRMPWETGESFVFYNTLADGIDAGQWARHFWQTICQGAGIRQRKFYATRHTFITEAIRRGENSKAVADFCGTSLAMIEQDYCGRLELLGDRTKFVQSRAFSVVVPTGIEPVFPT